ncbi:MAG: alcohol dehydrogenase catalytic domain-containing protein [Acidobacteriota bacterium]
MKAVRLDADGRIEVVEVPEPTAGPGEAVMRLAAAGICGSDLLDWYVRGKAGTILGHEVAGVIESVGDGVEGFAPGDRIVPHHHAPCLTCEACASGRYVHCPEWRASRLEPGGMAELVRVPAGNLARDTLRIPPHVSHEVASWTEPLATVVKAFSRGGFVQGQTALVVGLGSAGQLAVRLAAASGAARIVVADRVKSRIAVALASGAADAIDVSQEGLSPGARRASDGKGFDFVFVSPGKPDVIADASSAVAAGGTLLLFTMAAPGEALTLSPHDLYFREVRLVPSYSCGPDDTRAALGLIVSGRVAVEDLVTHRFPIEEAEAAFARARDPEGSVKVLIVPRDRPLPRGGAV